MEAPAGFARTSSRIDLSVSDAHAGRGYSVTTYSKDAQQTSAKIAS